MDKDLFGNRVLQEESFEIIYKGDSFSEGKILIRPLYLELQGLEELLKDTITLLIKNKKIDSNFLDFKIYIQIERGSIFEKVKVIFQHKTTIAIIGTFVIPFLNTTYNHFLNERSTSPNSQFYQEIKSIENDEQYKNNLKNILSPLGNINDNLLINNGTINININHSNKEEIIRSIDKKSIKDDQVLKNGEFKEELTGFVRKLDLDAPGNNYLGFNIDNGPIRIPTILKGEFNLNEVKEIINEYVKIRANVRYKDDQIKHIEILQYELVNKSKQDKLSF